MSLQVIDPDDVIYDILNQQYSGVIVMNEIPGSYLHHNLWGGPGNLFLNQVHPDTDVWSSRKSSFQWMFRIYQSVPFVPGLCAFSGALAGTRCSGHRACRQPSPGRSGLILALRPDSFTRKWCDPSSVKVEWQSRPPGFPWEHLWGTQQRSRHGAGQSTLGLSSC